MQITLKNNGCTAIIDNKGAELKSLRKADGREIMWCADPDVWGKSSPVLFPMIGNLSGGSTVINGKEYNIGKHGFARDYQFECEQTADNAATFIFTDNMYTTQSFPFKFSFSLDYILYPDGLEIIYTVKNNSDEEMPFCIGAHPAFAVDNLNNYRLVFEERETVNSPVMNLETRMWSDNNRIKRLDNSSEYKLNYSLFDNDCVYFDELKSHSVGLTDGKNGVRVSWDGFTSLGVWTPAGKNAGFVCIEPWCGCDDYDTDDGVFAHKRGIQIAKPNEALTYSMTIE